MYTIDKLNPIILKHTNRDIYLDEADITNEYIEKFDADTLFYDILQVDNKIYLNGPTLRNFRELLDNSNIYIDDELIEKDNIILEEIRFTQRSFILLPDNNRRYNITIEFKQEVLKDINIKNAFDDEDNNILNSHMENETENTIDDEHIDSLNTHVENKTENTIDDEHIDLLNTHIENKTENTIDDEHIDLLNTHIENKTENTIDDIEYETIIYTAEISQSKKDIYKNKKILITLQKDNHFKWIEDWINYYNLIHEIDTVIIFDNNSTNYTTEELLEHLKTSTNVETVIVIPTPFKYGPQGGTWMSKKELPWDAFFLQNSVIELAKYKYAMEAELVISVDIDELIYSNNQPVLNYMNEYNYVNFTGKWIENILDESTIENENQNIYSFKNFKYSISTSNRTTKKWCIKPYKYNNYENQWTTHYILGINPDLECNNNELFHYHYKPIALNWKYDRTNTKDELSKYIDYPLIMTLNTINEKNYYNIFDTLLYEINKHDQYLKKVYIYKEKTVVLNYLINGSTYSVDLYLNNNDIVIKIHASNEENNKILKEIYGDNDEKKHTILGKGSINDTLMIKNLISNVIQEAINKIEKYINPQITNNRFQ